jgi:uncharacterized protein YndB with AHSA1/START domain
MTADKPLDPPLARRVAPDAVRLERILDAPVDTVWQYLTDPELRGRWFMPGPIDPRPGGEMVLRVEHAAISPEPGEAPDWYSQYAGTEQAHPILAIDPPHLLRFGWEGGSEVTWTLEPYGEARTRFTILHAKLPNRVELVGVSGGWHSHSAVLAEVIAGKVPGNFWKTHARVDGIYDAAFPEPVPGEDG